MSRYRRNRVLFVCIGNACRSPMAEAIARVDAFDAIEAFSAGLAPTGFVTEMTKETLIKNGYWVEGLESKSISRKVWDQVDIVINMSGCPWELEFDEYSKVEVWDIEDPYGEDPETYQRAFEEIRLRVAKLAQKWRDDAARSAQASQSNHQKKIAGFNEQENLRLEARQTPRPGSMALNTANLPNTRPRTYARTAMPQNKTAVRPGRRLAGDEGSPAILGRRGDVFLVFGFLAGFAVLTMVKAITMHHDSPSEMIADVMKKTPSLIEAKKPAPPGTTSSSVANPPANKTQPQTPSVEPLSPEEVERILNSTPKTLPQPSNAVKKPLPAAAAKTPGHQAQGVPARDPSKNEVQRVSANFNISPVAKTQQQAPSGPPPAPPQMEAKIEQLANPVPLPSHDIKPPEPENKTSSAPAANQPAAPTNITGAVAILADPYPSLRIPSGGSKKQRQGTSLQLGHLLSRVEPVYPEDAKQQGIQGTVKLHAIIDRHGSVENLQSVNGPPVLVAAALNAVRQWRFSETLLAGQSVETEEDIDIVFRLSNSGAPRK